MLRRGSWIGATLVVLAFGLAATAAASLVPSGSTPTVTVPSGTTPSVTTPVATVPAVTTPSVTVPSVSTTPSSVPSVTVPSVTTPAVSTPVAKVPSVSTPTTSTPSVSSPIASSPTASASSGSASSARSATPSSSAPSGGSGTAPRPGASAAAASTRARRAVGRAARHAGAVPASVRRDRQLRHAVLGFRGCLSRLPRVERKVLVLRAGVGISHPRSRRLVARLTGLSPRRVARLERRGLRRLNALGASSACAASTQATTAPVAVPVTDGSSPDAGSRARIAVEAERVSSGAESSSPAPRSDDEAKLPLGLPALVNPRGAGAAFDLALVIAPLLLIGFLYLIARTVRRTT
jgi:hypothetical protein